MTLKTKHTLTALLLLLALTVQSQVLPKHEVRAVWLTTVKNLDWPRSRNADKQRQELRDILDQLQRSNVNTVLIQSRVRASTIYPSALEPFNLCMTGTHAKSPGYDALQFVVDECHRRGMECHAWVVTLPIGKWSEPHCREFVRKNPTMAKRIGDDGYMNPEDPRTGDYLARICAEITRQYDVDGIHLDYIRYPETWPAARKAAEKSRRRDNITAIVRKIHDAVKREKPWVKMSCSPIGKFRDLARYRAGGWNAYDAVSQDAQGWLHDGLMDMLFPMMYFQGNNFYPFLLDWREHDYGRIVVPGLGIYFLHPSEGRWTLDVIEREMELSRQYGMGHCYFRSKFFTDNTKGLYDFACRFDRHPALIPTMHWLHLEPPTPPATLSVSHGLQQDELQWTDATDHSGGPNLVYNVYASADSVVDTSDPANLLATRLTAKNLSVSHPTGRTLHYAVTAQDRYGNESQPALSRLPAPHFRKLPTPLDTSIPPFYDFTATKKKGKKRK